MLNILDRIIKIKTALIVPTYKPGKMWDDWLEKVSLQSYIPDQVVIIDSNSNDGTVDKSLDFGFKVIKIDRREFNHGGTRNRAFRETNRSNSIELVIFMTQDAILANKDSIKNILAPFKNQEIAAVCGRQKPYKNADPIAQHSRLYNYSSCSRINSKSDIKNIGLKAAYMSNSFAAYRVTNYLDLGGFPENLIFGEDMYLAAKMLLAGNKTFYASNAVVNHSHNYSIWEEYKRYFDIGVFHKTQSFLLEKFGSPSGEGLQFAASEIKYTYKYGNIIWTINSILRTGVKFIGYQLGKRYTILPLSWRKIFSMDKNYWNGNEKT